MRNDDRAHAGAAPVGIRANRVAGTRNRQTEGFRRSRGAAVLLLGTCLAALLTRPAYAASDTWTGSGTTSNWSDTANWSTAAAPANGDSVILGQTGAFAPSNFNINVTLNSFTLNTAGAGTNSLTSGYIINSGGGTLGLASGGSITDNAVNGAADQINIGIGLNGPATISVASGATGLDISGAITGAGGLTVSNASGASALQFLGTNTYSGGTTISAGTLQIGNGGTTGSILGNVTDNGTLAFDRSDAISFDGNISGTGGVTQLGSGTLTLTGANSYSGGTVIANGTVSASYDNNLGASAGAIEIDNGSTLELARWFSTARNIALVNGGTIDAVSNAYGPSIFTGVISGTGGLSLTGSGMVQLTNASTYSGGTSISSTNTLSFGLTSGSAAGSVTGAIVNSGVLQFNRSNDATFANAISGSGKVQKYQADTITLTGTNTYTGGTQIFAGTLQIGDGVTNGSITGDVSLLATGATLAFDQTSNLTFAGAITGLGTLAQMGSHTLTLTGANTLGGISIGSGSTLQLGDGTNGSLIFVGSSGIADNGTLAVDLPSSLTLNQDITGSGALNQIGAGTTILTGTNSYTGGTTIAGGTLQIGSGSTSGSVSGDIVDNATLAFDRSDNLIYAGAISGTGAVIQEGFGTTILTGASTYSGGTTISSGALQLGNGGTTGAIAGDVVDNGQLNFDRSDNLTFSDVISGTGSVGQAGGGTLTLSGTNSYSGGTNISGGILAVSDGTNLGSGTVAFANGATLQFLGGTSLALEGSLGTGGGTIDTNGYTVSWSGTMADASGATGNGLTKTGAGTLILTGGNSYTGGTTISAGILQVGNGGTAGSITGDVTDNAALAFDLSSALSFGGAISGSGAVDQNGSGVLTLSGTNTFTGGTNINAGTLSVSSDANLGTGGTLAMAAGTTLATTATDSFAHDVTVTGDPTFSVAAGTTTTWSGLISDGGSAGTIEIAGGGTFKPTNTANSYSGGTIVRAGSTLSIDADGELGAAAGGLTLGDASTSGTLNVASSFTLGAGRSVALAAGGGTIDSNSGVAFEIGQGISGAGALTVTGAGTLTLAGASSYSGGTTLSGGTLQLGDGTTAGTIAGDVADNGALIFNEAGDVTMAGAISGSGTLTQNDATGHTVSLTGTNTYTGGTTITAGILSIGNGGSTGSITGDILDNAALVFDRTGTLIYGGAISGTGTVSQSGSGTTVLTGDGTYTGGTTIAAGTLQIGNSGTTGSITGDVADNGTIAFDRSDSLIFAGAISGTGALAQIGAGTTILSGTNTYGGGTTIAAGTLQIGNGGTTGSIAGNVADSGTLAFDRSDLVTFGGVISGTGALAQIGSGTTILAGANTYSGGTTVSSGVLQIGNGGTTGSIAGDVADNASLVFDRSDTLTYSGAISGTGTLEQAGSGTLVLTGANTVSGGTAISAGTLQVGAGGTSGSLAGNVADAGSLVFDRSDTLVFGGVISGSGSVMQTGTGTTILTGDNTYTGGTTISAGTLQLGNSGASGSLAGDVTDNGTLAFDRSDSVTFGGVISGTGAVAQTGSGTLTLTATNSYSGATTVESGILLVDGSIGSSSGVVVDGGATIGGTGTVSNLTVATKATVAPGDSGIGTLNVNGNLSLGSGAIYAFDATSSGGDLLSVSGKANLGGTLSVDLLGSGYTTGTQITVASAGAGLTGTFSSLDILASSLGNLNPYLSYDANNAYLLFMPTIASLVPPTGAGSNETRVADAIDFAIRYRNGGLTFLPLAGMSATNLTTTLSEMTGEVATGVQNVALSSVGSFLGNLLDPSVGGRRGLADGAGAVAENSSNVRVAYNGPDAEMPYEENRHAGVSAWGSFNGGYDQNDGSSALGTNKLTATRYGGIVGLDYMPAAGNGAIGIAAGLDRGSWDLAGHLGKGSATAYEAGLYYSRRFGRNYVAAALSYGQYHATTDRTLNLGGTNLYHAQFTAWSVASRAEVGHSFSAGADTITPYARFQAVDLGLPDYAETTVAGSPSFALTYTGSHHFDYTSEAGAAWGRMLTHQSGSTTDLHARIGWRHDYSGELKDVTTFSAFSGASFGVMGASLPRDAGHIELGVQHNIGNFALSLNADALAGSTAQSYGGTAAVSYRW